MKKAGQRETFQDKSLSDKEIARRSEHEYNNRLQRIAGANFQLLCSVKPLSRIKAKYPFTVELLASISTAFLAVQVYEKLLSTEIAVINKMLQNIPQIVVGGDET